MTIRPSHVNNTDLFARGNARAGQAFDELLDGQLAVPVYVVGLKHLLEQRNPGNLTPPPTSLRLVNVLADSAPKPLKPRRALLVAPVVVVVVLVLWRRGTRVELLFSSRRFKGRHGAHPLHASHFIAVRFGLGLFGRRRLAPNRLHEAAELHVADRIRAVQVETTHELVEL